MRGPRTQPVVEARADAVEARVGVGGVHGGCLVGVARGQDDLAGLQQLAGAKHGRPAADLLHERLVVAAPPEVEPPDLAVPPAEAWRARGEDGGRVVSGAPVPARSHPGALLDRPALRVLLPDPAAGLVERFE